MSERGPAAADHRAALGRTIRQLRRDRGLTLRDLGTLLEVSPATLSGIENGKTGLSSVRLTRVADALDVPVDRLLDETALAQASPERPAVVSSPLVTPVLVDGGWRSFPALKLNAALGGALSSFLEFGYHGATMRTIAERAGLSVPGLYHYYPSKQEMLVAILDLTMTDLRARTEAAREEGHDPVERFTNVVECLALYHTHRRELAFVGASEMRSLNPVARRRLAALRRDEQRIVDVEVQKAVRSGAFLTTRPHEAARAVVTMCTALAQWFGSDGPASAEIVAAQYVEFALALVGAVAVSEQRTVPR